MVDEIPAAAGEFANSSLYVGDLDTNVNDDFFYEIFNSVAPVICFQICRDQSRKNSSLCHAFVKFRNIHDATTAMKNLYFTKINGKSIRIMFSHIVPSTEKISNANVFIKNLDSSIDNEMLYRNFATFGTILSCKVVTNDYGKSKGYGFVQFEREASAKNAIDSLNGMLMNGKRVYVGSFVRKQERIQVNESSRFTDVYVKNLPEAMMDDDLKQLFGTHGTISSATVMRDSNGKSRCFGFVNFQNEDAAANAVEKLNATTIGDDKILYVGRAQKKAERHQEFLSKTEHTCGKTQGANLYVKNFDHSIDDEKLKELFSKFGTIISCKVMRDKDGLSMGFGFVAFSTPQEATCALNEMNRKMIGQKPLYVGVAQPKKERMTQIQRLLAQLQAPVKTPPLHHEIPRFLSGAPPFGYGTSRRVLPPPPVLGFQHFLPTMQTANSVAVSLPSKMHSNFSSTVDDALGSTSPSSEIMRLILGRKPPVPHPAPSHAAEELNSFGDGPLDERSTCPTPL